MYVGMRERRCTCLTPRSLGRESRLPGELWSVQPFRNHLEGVVPAIVVILRSHGYSNDVSRDTTGRAPYL